MPNYDIITIGGITQDIFTRAESSKILQLREAERQRELLCFEYGAKIHVDQVAFTFGGGGANTAVAFSRFGLATAALGVTGEDQLKDAIHRNFQENAVDTSFLLATKKNQTGMSVILNSFEGDRTVLTYRGANSDLSTDDIDWDRLSDTSWIYLASLSGKGISITRKLASIIRDNGIKLAWTPGTKQISVDSPRKAFRELLELTDVLTMNKEEAALFTGEQPNYSKVATHFRGSSKHGVETRHWVVDLSTILKTLKSFGPKIVVVTDGKRGVQVYDGKTHYVFGIYPQEIVDTLGAGDSFASGLVTGLFYDKGVEYGIKLGTANAASVVSKYGAQSGLLDCATAESIIRQNKTMDVQKGTLP